MKNPFKRHKSKHSHSLTDMKDMDEFDVAFMRGMHEHVSHVFGIAAFVLAFAGFLMGSLKYISLFKDLPWHIIIPATFAISIICAVLSFWENRKIKKIDSFDDGKQEEFIRLLKEMTEEDDRNEALVRFAPKTDSVNSPEQVIQLAPTHSIRFRVPALPELKR